MTSRDKGARAPSQRQLKVGELIRHALAEIFSRGDVVDDVIARHSLTVPEVRMSPDLKIATVFVMPLGGENAERIVKALARNAKALRAMLAREINQLKFMPELRFRLDTRFDDDDRMREVLASPRIVEDLERKEGEDGSDV